MQYVVIRSASPPGKKQGLASLSQPCSRVSSHGIPFGSSGNDSHDGGDDDGEHLRGASYGPRSPF